MIMNESYLENISGIWGLVLAVIIMAIVYLINRHVGKKKRLFDERYYVKANRAKARSWDTMLIIYLIAWFIVIIFDGISFSFFLITALYVSHNGSLIVTTAIVNKDE